MPDISKELMKQEALERLKFIKAHQTIIDRFEEGELMVTVAINILFALTPEEKEYVREFEEETGSLVFHVIKTETSMFGTLYSFLNVSPYEEDWGVERAALAEMYPLVYVRNAEDKMLSDFGTIGIEVHNGCILRTE